MTFAYTNKKGTKYYLHGRTTKLPSGASRTLYFFSKEQKEGTLDKLPEGYEVSESRNGLPVLKKKAS